MLAVLGDQIAEGFFVFFTFSIHPALHRLVFITPRCDPSARIALSTTARVSA
jgi:hypothetical protein